jgi:signal transduction histidine kinase
MTSTSPATTATMLDETLSVLVIDDDVTDRMAIRRYLSKSPLQASITEAETAQDATGLLADETFDCIFLDFGLPDTDGLSFVKQLRLAGKTLPIIVLTGQGDEHIAVELMKAGASDYLAKSRLSPDSLQSLIRHAISTYRAEQRVKAAQEQLRLTNSLLRQQNQELEAQRQQIEQQNLKLLKANQHKTEFLATVSHELRTPLNSILGFSQILKNQTKGPLNDYQMKMIDCIHTNGQSLLYLVNDILDMSTIESEGLKLLPQFFDVTVLVHEVISELQWVAEEKGLKIEKEINLKEQTIYNDRQRLKQVLTNLLSNAIKFTEAGRITVGVAILAINSLEISVRDTGIGIEPDQISTIFQPFQQVDQSIVRQYGGTGLGLAITHSLVSMMEGFITVDSQPGEGSTFRVQIPLKIAEST